MDTRDWSDIGYNMLVRGSNGTVYEGRGLDVLGAHATDHNTSGIGVCITGDDGRILTPAVKRAVRELYDQACARAGRRLAMRVHRDVGQTACPGDDITAWVRKGMPVDGSPRPPSTRPAPGPDVEFPLPVGYWFGIDDGTDRSVSGAYGRTFRGRLDRDWIRTFVGQLAKRGWSIGKGKTWLTRYGSDGRMGGEHIDLVRAFQRDQGLPATGRIDKRTWDAAYHNPVTP